MSKYKVKKNKIKFLVLGAHGDIGISICKVIKKSFKNAIVEGSDIKSHGMGDLIFDKVHKISGPHQNKYKTEIKKIANKFDLIIPSNEKEIYFLSKNNLGINEKLLINNFQIINKFTNKIKLNNFLKIYYSNLSLSFCVTSKDFNKIKKKQYPLFLKKNMGSGNQGYLVIKNKSEMNKKVDKDMVAQEYLDKDYEEFTCGIFRARNFTSSIIFKRKLHPSGFTYHAKVYENNKISKIMENLANNINLYGSLNIQFKKKGNKIKVFDINTRLSSTVFFRDLMGFKDLVWWIKDKLKKAYSPKFNIKKVKNQTIVKIFEDKII